jgi:hypothetical protein
MKLVNKHTTLENYLCVKLKENISKQKEFSTDSIRKFEEIILRHLVWLGYDIPALIYFKRLNLESK